MWPSKTKAAYAFLAPSPTKRQGWALQRKLFRKRARHFPRSHRPFSINGKIAAFFSLLVSREADTGNGHAACACPFLTQHGPLFCPPERKGPRNAERWQDLRPMHDSRDLDAKEGPSWQDSRAMYPKSPDCTPKRIHGTKILPTSARKACISCKRCQGGPLFRAISEKRIHGARILPQQPKQPRR